MYGYDSIKVVRAAPSQRLTGVWVQLHKKGVRAALCQWLKCMGASFLFKKTSLLGRLCERMREKNWQKDLMDLLAVDIVCAFVSLGGRAL